MSRRPTNFDNLSHAALADAYGDLSAEIRGLELRRDALKAALLDRADNAPEVIGDRFKVAISTTTRWNLDLAAVRERLGEAWCSRHSKLARVTSLRTSQIALAASAPLAA